MWGGVETFGRNKQQHYIDGAADIWRGMLAHRNIRKPVCHIHIKWVSAHLQACHVEDGTVSYIDWLGNDWG